MDLQELLARAEAATYCNKSFLWDVCKDLGVPLGTVWSNGPTSIGDLIEARAWECAALALVEAKLPSLKFDYWSVDAFNQATVGDGDRIRYFANGRTPALSLVAALIKALIAQEQQA